MDMPFITHFTGKCSNGSWPVWERPHPASSLSTSHGVMEEQCVKILHFCDKHRSLEIAGTFRYRLFFSRFSWLLDSQPSVLWVCGGAMSWIMQQIVIMKFLGWENLLMINICWNPENFHPGSASSSLEAYVFILNSLSNTKVWNV